MLAACFGGTPAWGLEPGVYVDPGSPAAKQYVLPLNQARQTGASAARVPSSSSPAPSSSRAVFGGGITPPGGGGAGPASGASAGTPAPATRSSRARNGAARKARGGGARHAASRAAAPVPLPAAALRASRTRDSSAGSGSLLALLGGGLAILILGAFGGTVLRHSRPSTPSA